MLICTLYIIPHGRIICIASNYHAVLIVAVIRISKSPVGESNHKGCLNKLHSKQSDKSSSLWRLGTYFGCTGTCNVHPPLSSPFGASAASGSGLLPGCAEPH
uniref:(northern house mosquito) hypothetical protein n=1 Tax=Culex pipiens TaxID=7175 RepID=A0A8D8KE52_CULPI